ncbi:FAD-dependent oxidoreductase [bacterium]|nr:FAD-dependent oxidoreductase [bacterium]
MGKIKIKFNNKELEVESSKTILDIAKENGIFIPTLCEEARLEHYASCRVCLVEVKGAKAFMPACSTIVREGMEIIENSKDIQESRTMALELMLSNHYADCYAPCNRACPANIDIQGYIAHIANGEYRKSLELIKRSIALPVSIGRVCPQFCTKECYRNNTDEHILINPLKRFVAEMDINSDSPYIPKIEEEKNVKVAIIGAGPAGLSAAYYLRIKGYSVTIFEKLPKAGGMLRYGIPTYRLPKKLLDKEIGILETMGIVIKTNTELGKDITFEQLKEQGYRSFFIGIGAQNDMPMGIPGEDAKGSYQSVEFLRKVSLGETPEFGERCAIVGGGNTAMDVSRTLVRLGAKEVHIIYRRNKEAMPANVEEIVEAEEEGVQFNFLKNPTKVVVENNIVKGLKLINMKLGEPDQSGRRRPIAMPETEHFIEFDTVITAIGQKIDISVLDKMGLKYNKRGRVEVKENVFSTNIPGVFSGGDCVLGPSTVVESVAQGREAAITIDSYLEKNEIREVPYEFFIQKKDFKNITEKDFEDIEKIWPPSIKRLPANVRKNNFEEFEFALTEMDAINEAKRCMQCGCQDINECKLKEYSTKYKVDKTRFFGEFIEKEEDTSHPYIKFNINKCILCGKCVRTCEELVGANALGYVNRGFPTQISPQLEKTFLDSPECISCGQCAEVCPVGAIVSIPDTVQPGPHDITYYDSVCGNCDLGCEVKLGYNKDEFKIVRGNPESEINHGLLCAFGKYGTSYLRHFYTDFENDTSTLKSYIEKNSNKKIAVAVGSGFTNEEYFSIINYFKKITDKIGTFEKDGIMGFSSAKFDDIISSDRIFLVNTNMEKIHGSLRYFTTQATRKGAKFIYVGNEPHESLMFDEIHGELLELKEKDIVIIHEKDITENRIALLEGKKYIILKSNANENGRDYVFVKKGITHWNFGDLMGYDILVTFNNSIPLNVKINKDMEIVNIGLMKTGTEEHFIQNIPIQFKRGSIFSADLKKILLKQSDLNKWVKNDFSSLGNVEDTRDILEVSSNYRLKTGRVFVGAQRFLDEEKLKLENLGIY